MTAYSGKPVEALTLDAVRSGEVGLDDIRVAPATLEHQARVAAEHGNPQLAENLRRAAELATLPDSEVLAVYEALRPHRSTAAQLLARADTLAARGLTRCAAWSRRPPRCTSGAASRSDGRRRAGHRQLHHGSRARPGRPGRRADRAGADRLPARGPRATAASLDAAAALLRRLERSCGERATLAAAAPLRPVTTSTAMAEPPGGDGRVRIVWADASTTAGGRGRRRAAGPAAGGRHGLPGGPVIVVVPGRGRLRPGRGGAPPAGAGRPRRRGAARARRGGAARQPARRTRPCRSSTRCRPPSWTARPWWPWSAVPWAPGPAALRPDLPGQRARAEPGRRDRRASRSAAGCRTPGRRSSRPSRRPPRSALDLGPRRDRRRRPGAAGGRGRAARRPCGGLPARRRRQARRRRHLRGQPGAAGGRD